MSHDNPSSQRPPHIELLRAQTRGYPDLIKKAEKAVQAAKAKAGPGTEETKYVFTLYTGNRWLEVGEREADPQMLFGEFWYRDELCILFADTNAGKSVLAVQIGNSISRRQRIGSFAQQAKKAVVLYVDFELSAKQFHLRYSDASGAYAFSDNFYRAQLNMQNEMPADPELYDQYIMAAITDRITQLNATVLIIDNITCMRNGTENSRVALKLMKSLRDLKSAHSLSILVLAHTPKRNPALPITTNDLQGSKLLINFADSAFAIGKSNTQPGICYLKQVKQRSTAEKHGAENVCLCRITKPKNFLQFQFTGQGTERDHLYRRSQQDRDRLAQQVATLTKQGHSQRRIAQALRIPLTTVNRLMQAG